MKPAYSMKTKDVLEYYKTSDSGLTNQEVEYRIEKYGKNVLPEKNKNTIVKVFFSQFNDPITFILIVAIVLSFIIGEIVDAWFIVFVIVSDAIFGTIQEWRASKNAEALKNVLSSESTVLRDNKEVVIKAEYLVPGDIVLLSSGDKVNADMRIISSHNLKSDESALTGESLPQVKDTKTLKEDTPLSNRKNMLYAGSTIVSGRAIAVVTETGSKSEFGLIASKVISEKDTMTPLAIRMEKFSRQIGIVFSALAIILTFILYYKNYATRDIFFLVVALSVSAIPEGLSVSMTLALSIASNRMSKKNILVKKLNSVESLGSCTVIASDKTGTLTVNEQTAKIIVLPNNSRIEIGGSGYNPIGYIKGGTKIEKENALDIAYLGCVNNEAHLDYIDNKWVGSGDSVDIAFLSLAGKFDLSYDKERESVCGMIPYESEQGYSAVFYKDGKNICNTVKGSTEKVLSFCDTMLIDNKKVKLDKKLIIKLNNELASEGYRVIALADGVKKSFVNKETYDSKDIDKLTFVGLVGFIDPIREEALYAIKKSKEAGIRTIMITGDHPLTATKIAYDLELINTKDEVTTGEEVLNYYKQGNLVFDEFVKSKTIFTRVTPVDKYHIVESLKRQGEFVAVTGDGVNDALAMKCANIGVAIGSGTEVAKETGSMIITDDNFSSIVNGIEEGRIAYNNIRKVIYMLLSCAFAEVLFFLLAIIFDYDPPLLAVQLLWLNLVTDGIQDVAVAYEKGHGYEMKSKPRSPKESIFNKLFIEELLLSGLYIGVVVFGLWVYLIDELGMDVILARSYVLLLMVFLQNVHVFNCRSEVESIFKLRLKDNYFLIVSIASVLLIQFVVSEVDFLSNIISAKSLPISHVLILFVLSLPIILLMELFKLYKKKKGGLKYGD